MRYLSKIRNFVFHISFSSLFFCQCLNPASCDLCFVGATAGAAVQATYFKALAGGNRDRQVGVLCMLERWLVEAQDLKDMRSTLNQLYNLEVVDNDETFERWFETPNLSM